MDAHDWDERYRARDIPWDAEPSRLLVGAVGGLKPGTALDLASGDGRNAVWLAGRGWRVTAVDWSRVGAEKGLQMAEERGVEVDWQIADLTAWEPPDEGFDLVIILYLQIPEEERHRVWRTAAAAVTLGGRLVIIGHDSRNLEEGYGGPAQPAVLYTASEAAAVVGESLRVDRAEAVVRPVDTDEGQRLAIDNVVIAERV
jgi:SAM-dependent methyltransferase